MARYEVEVQTRTRTTEEISSILNEAKFNFDKGKKSGLYVAPYKTDQINYQSGERFRRMASYISNLERELNLPYKH